MATDPLPREGEVLTFQYSRWRLLFGLVVFAVGGVLLVAVGFGWRSTGSTLSGVLICATGLWAFFYVARRASNPVKFQVAEGDIKAVYWNGRIRRWPIRALRARPPSARSRWEASVVVCDLTSGHVAFRVFQDLPRLDDLRAALGEEHAAV